MEYDFSGWATVNNVRCSDGRTILRDAFKHDDGKKVPLVWNHSHDEPTNVLGHALLENREKGVYAYCKFNDTEYGQHAKALVEHGDINGLSIYANKLKQTNTGLVSHGEIRELSLVLATANPEAFIDNVVKHSDDGDEILDDEVIIYTGEVLEHACNPKKKKTIEHAKDDENKDVELEDADDKKEDKMADENKGKTVKEIFDSMTEEQQTAVAYMVGKALEESGAEDDETDDSEGEKKEMKHNVFDNDYENPETVLTHADETNIIARAKKDGSFKRAMEEYIADNEKLAHGFATDNGDDDVSFLFPEYKDVKPGAPELITRDYTWVDAVMNGVHKSPISRIRTRQTDIRGEDLTAMGYKKGTKKTDLPNVKFIKRTTDPQTVYIKDKMNRDDIIDITDFDVVAYQYQIMDGLLKEELAKAILIGDGREDGDEAKIAPEHIRPIWTDDELYTIHAPVDVAAAKAELQGTNTGANFGENYIFAEAVITAALYAREKYKGSGNLTMYCTPHVVNKMLLARDLNGRRIYNSKADLEAALNVSSIQTVEQFEGKVRTDTNQKKHNLLALFVNLNDYQVGSTKGGQITRFNQFDIDFNQEKYLIETRLSGALTRIFSAIALEEPQGE